MERNEDSIDLSRLFWIMYNHKSVVFGIVGVCMAIAVVIAFALPKQYESTTLVQTRTAAKVDISGAAAAMAALGVGGGVSSPTMNYIELMKSRTVLDPIIDSMKFEEEKKPDAKVFAKKYLDIRNTKGTNLIEVAARAETPEEAQKISQSVVDNFLLMQTEMNQQTQSLLVKFLDKRIEESKKASEDAEKKLVTYSKAHKIYSPDEQVKYAVARMQAFDKAMADFEVQIQSGQASLETL